MSKIKQVIPYAKDYQYTAWWFIALIISAFFGFVLFVSSIHFSKHNEVLGFISLLSGMLILFFSIFVLIYSYDRKKHRRYRKADLYFTLNDKGVVVCFNDLPPIGKIALHVALGKKTTCTMLFNELQAWRKIEIGKIELTCLNGDNTYFHFTSYYLDSETKFRVVYISDMLEYALLNKNCNTEGNKFFLNYRSLNLIGLDSIVYAYNAWDRTAIELETAKSVDDVLVKTLAKVLVNIVLNLVEEKRKSEPARRMREAVENGIIGSLEPEVLKDVLVSAECMLRKMETSASEEIFEKLKARLITSSAERESVKSAESLAKMMKVKLD